MEMIGHEHVTSEPRAVVWSGSGEMFYCRANKGTGEYRMPVKCVCRYKVDGVALEYAIKTAKAVDHASDVVRVVDHRTFFAHRQGTPPAEECDGHRPPLQHEALLT